MKQLAADNETQASEMTRLRYEHQFLQSEYDNDKEQFARVAAETRIRHEAEVICCSLYEAEFICRSLYEAEVI